MTCRFAQAFNGYGEWNDCHCLHSILGINISVTKCCIRTYTQKKLNVLTSQCRGIDYSKLENCWTTTNNWNGTLIFIDLDWIHWHRNSIENNWQGLTTPWSKGLRTISNTAGIDKRVMINYTDYMVLPCGGVAYYDEPKYGMNYFCAQCQCVVGSDNTVSYTHLTLPMKRIV